MNISTVSIGDALVYDSAIASVDTSHISKLKLKVADVAKGIPNAVMEGKNFIDLVMSCCDDEDRYVDIPWVRVRISS